MKIKLMLVAGLWSFTSSSFALDLVETYERAKLNDPTWQANQQQFEADQLNLGSNRRFTTNSYIIWKYYP